MKRMFDFRENFKTQGKMQKQGTEISREDFEKHFKKTKEKITFTFGGWDGKSYEGQTRTGCIYRTDIEGYEDAKFIKVGKGVHFVDDNYDVLETATGKTHKGTWWALDVARA